jgi:dGTPase
MLAGTYHGELVQDCSAAPFIVACKSIAREVVYKTDEVLRIELAARRMIQDLLGVFWSGAEKGGPKVSHKDFPGKAYFLMSHNYRTVFENQLKRLKERTTDIPEAYFRIQLVCDQIAGMTDTFAMTLHRKLINA